MQTYNEEQHDIKELIKSGVSVCIQFSAKWCGPCKRITPELKKIANVMPAIHFFYIDVDEWEDISGEDEFNVSQLPTFVFCKNGREVCERVTGANLEAVKINLSNL
jgi:thioredoxin 1